MSTNVSDKRIHTYDIGFLGKLDATAISEGIKNKDFTAQEVVASSVERSKAVHSKINAVVTDCYDEALSRNVFAHDGLFAGVPTFIKDLNDYKGLPTFMGSAGVKNVPAKANDPFVNDFLAVTGSVVLGKSSTSEYGLLPCGETLVHGDSHNPWQPEYSTGGSSAGAGALVAAGVVSYAHASDGGGSIRIPACCNGLIGLKPSRGRLNFSPTKHPMVPVDIAVDGIVSRTVRDTASYYHAMDRYQRNPALPPISLVTEPGKKRLKIAVFYTSPTDIECQGEVKDAVVRTAQLLEDMGHTVEYIDNPVDAQFFEDFSILYSYLAFMGQVGQTFKNGLGNYVPGKAAKFTKEFGAGYSLLAAPSIAAFKRLKAFQQKYEPFFEDWDIQLSPVLSHPAPKLGHFGPHERTLEVLLRLQSYVNYTTTQNASGAPAISLPMGMSSEGIPIGVQLAGKLGSETTLLELAFELEQADAFALEH